MISDADRADNAAEIDRLALALAKEPGSKAFIPLAEEYGKAGMWAEAAAVLEDGLKTYPSFITAMVALGRAYDQMKQPVKAKAVLEEAVKLSPENLRAHRTLAKIYAAEGAKDAALRSCAIILAVNPQDQEALSLRATLGASASPAQPDPSTPLRTTQPSKPAAGVPVLPEAKLQPSAALSEPAVPVEGAQSAPIAQLPQEPVGQVAGTAASTARQRRKVTVTQLEQWLTTIRARRRDRGRPTKSDSPTS
jgi:tetratricopeptide (TPR) repeat protein